jgi:riboflavin synthase
MRRMRIHTLNIMPLFFKVQTLEKETQMGKQTKALF